MKPLRNHGQNRVDFPRSGESMFSRAIYTEQAAPQQTARTPQFVSSQLHWGARLHISRSLLF